MAKRKTISKKTRFEIFKRDVFTCQYCGNNPPKVVLEVDHILPVFEGGDNSDLNLITSCFDCNRGKGKHCLSDVPNSLSSKIKIEKDKFEQIDKYEKFLKKIRKKTQSDIDDLGTHWYNRFCYEESKYLFSNLREPTIKTFLKKMLKSDIIDSMDIAHSRIPARESKYGISDEKTWKYFCGVCWRKIKQDGEF